MRRGIRIRSRRWVSGKDQEKSSKNRGPGFIGVQSPEVKEWGAKFPELEELGRDKVSPVRGDLVLPPEQKARGDPEAGRKGEGEG